MSILDFTEHLPNLLQAQRQMVQSKGPGLTCIAFVQETGECIVNFVLMKDIPEIIKENMKGESLMFHDSDQPWEKGKLYCFDEKKEV